MTATVSPPPARMRPALKVLMIASLALNMLVIGAVGATLLGARHGRGPLGGMHGMSASGATLLSFLRSLPDARREELWTATAIERAGLSRVRLEVRKAREEMHRSLLAEPFDKARFAAAQTAYAVAEASGRAATQPLFVEIAARLSLEERRAYVRWQVERQPGGGKGGRRGAKDAAAKDDGATAPATEPQK